MLHFAEKYKNSGMKMELITMKKEELEKYIGELSPEMQEKARACKDMQELNALLAENDVELSEDALEQLLADVRQIMQLRRVPSFQKNAPIAAAI